MPAAADDAPLRLLMICCRYAAKMMPRLRYADDAAAAIDDAARLRDMLRIFCPAFITLCRLMPDYRFVYFIIYAVIIVHIDVDV